MTHVLLYLVIGCAGLMGGMAISELLLTRRRKLRPWHDLVANLGKVDGVGLEAVAMDYLTPRKGQLELTTEEIWDFVGGYEGLKKMRRNVEIMLELSSHCQMWNFDEAVIVTLRMQQDAVTLRRALRRIELGMMPIHLRRFRLLLPLHAQEAAASYYLLRERLLKLYQTSHAGLHPKLAAAL